MHVVVAFTTHHPKAQLIPSSLQTPSSHWKKHRPRRTSISKTIIVSPLSLHDERNKSPTASPFSTERRTPPTSLSISKEVKKTPKSTSKILSNQQPSRAKKKSKSEYKKTSRDEQKNDNTSNSRNENNRRRISPQRKQHNNWLEPLVQKARTLRELDDLTNDILKQDKKKLSSRDVTDFIKLLGSRGAHDSILQKVLRHDCGRNIGAYTCAIAALAQSRNVSHRKAGLALFFSVAAEAVEEKGDLSERPGKISNNQLKPNSFTFTAAFLAAETHEEASNIMKLIQDSEKNVHIYNSAIYCCSRSYLKSGLLTTAMIFYEEMKIVGIDPNERTYDNLLHCCAKQSSSISNDDRIKDNILKIVKSLLEDMKELGLSINAKSWGGVFSACAALGAEREAISFFDDMKKNYRQVMNILHYNTYLGTLAKAGRDQLAMEVLDDMLLSAGSSGGVDSKRTVVVPDTITVNTVLKSFVVNDNYNGAKSILDRMKKGEFQVWRNPMQNRIAIKPDIITYNSILTACRDPKEAKELIQEIRMSRRYRQNAIPIDIKTYTIAISICRKSNPPDLQTAKYLFDLAVKDDGIKPNEFLYGSLIWVAERCGDYNEAFSVFSRMENDVNVDVNVVAYDGVFSACATKCADLAGGNDVVTAEKDDTIKEIGRLVLQLFLEMRSTEIRPTHTTFQRIALVASKMEPDKIFLLEEVLSSMDEKECDSRLGGPIIEGLIYAYASLGRFLDARRVFECLEVTSAADYLDDKNACLIAMLYACSIAKPPRSAEAIKLLEDIRASKYDSSLLSYPVIACAKTNRWGEALELIEKYGMVENSSVNEEMKGAVTVSALNSVISACGRCRRPDMSLMVLNDMPIKYGVKPDARTYNSAIIACNQAEHEKRLYSKRTILDEQEAYNDSVEEGDELQLQWWECALSLLRRMQEEGISPDKIAYSSAISACQSAGQWQRAIGVLQIMNKRQADEDDGKRDMNVFCQNAAISACEKGGAWLEALELFERMRSSDAGTPPNFVTVNTLLVALVKAGQMELAESIYADSVRDRIVKPWKYRLDVNGKQVRMLDLHQFSAPMAKIAVSCIVNSLPGLKPRHNKTKDLIIIAGKGRVSSDRGGGDPQPYSILGPVVQKLLSEEYSIESKVEESNFGQIRISSESLCTFVENMSYFHWDKTVEESL